MKTLAPLLLLATQLAAQPNASVWVTDAMKASKSLAASTAQSPKDFLTIAETSQWQDTGNYEEAVGFYQRLAKSSPYGRLIEIGQTPQGRPLFVFVASKDHAFNTPDALATGKPIILLQNGIHAGENGGKDAAMMLLRDVLVTKKYAAWLDSVIILSIPVFNADGLENVSPYNRINEQGPNKMGFRSQSQRLNLNRDYMKADAPEMRAWLRLFNTWKPDFLIDNHVTDGQDMQHDMTIAIHSEQDIDPGVGAWMNQRYIAKFWKNMESEGHVMGWYGGGPLRAQGTFNVQYFSPRYSTGYAAARHRASILVETHSLKPFKVRAWGHYNLMRFTIDELAASGKELRAATSAADRRKLAGTKVAIDFVPGKTGVPYVYKGLETETYTGTAANGPVLRYLPKVKDSNVTLVRGLEAKVEVTAPAGYLIPREYTDLIALLDLHGIRYTRKPTLTEGAFDTYCFENARFAAVLIVSGRASAASVTPFEGRFMPNYETKPVKVKRRFQPGAVYVAVDQPLGKLAMYLLEPGSPDSVVKWGFLNSIFEQKEYFSDYIFEPIAEKMLADDPKLKAEFETEFSKTPHATPRDRLAWLFQRSPYYEQDKDAYPVVKVN